MAMLPALSKLMVVALVCLLALAGLRTAKADDIPLYPATTYTPEYPAEPGYVTFEIRYYLPSDGYVFDPDYRGSWIAIDKVTSTSTDLHIFDRMTGLDVCPAQPEDPRCRPGDQWIVEYFTVNAADGPFTLALRAGQNYACFGNCPGPQGDPREHIHPGIIAWEAPGVGAYVRQCQEPPPGESSPYCPPPPEASQCDAVAGAIRARELVVGGLYAGSDPDACQVILQRRTQPGAPANLIGQLSFDDSAYSAIAGVAFGRYGATDGNMFVLLKGLPEGYDNLAVYTPGGGAPTFGGVSGLPGEPTSLTLDPFDEPIIGTRATAERPGRGIHWGSSTLFPEEDVVAVHRAQNSCTLYYATPTQVRQYNICANSGTSQPFVGGTAAAITALPGGDVLLAREGWVARYSPDGTNLSTYSIAGVTGLATDEDSTFWVVTPSSLKRYPITGTGPLESLDYQGSTFAPETVAVNYAFPPKPIIFVHGFRQSAAESNFDDILSPIEEDLGQDSVTRFVWYQDKVLAGASCPGSFPTGAGSIYINPLGLADQACDSQAAIGPNAVRLHAAVRDKYWESGGQRVILLGYSQGGAIVRGMLAYAAEVEPDVANTMVDSVFFFATVHEGSYFARLGVATQGWLTSPSALATAGLLGRPGANWLTYWTMKAVADQAGLYIDRPAIHDLDPNGTWMEWANDPVRQLPQIPYFNAYGSISVKVSGCVWKLGCADVPFMSGNVGDAVILAGNDPDPYDGPSVLGGSRFRPDTGASVEWEMKDTVRFNAAKLAIPVFGPVAGGEEFTEVVLEILGSPVMHTQLPGHTAEITVASCGSGVPVNLADEVVALMRNRAGVGGYRC